MTFEKWLEENCCESTIKGLWWWTRKGMPVTASLVEYTTSQVYYDGYLKERTNK